jgi:ATP-dependent RNA circularization protein (DNA/RNA ligase family)
MLSFCEKYNLQTVPFLKICQLSEIGTSVKEIVDYSIGKSLINPNIDREGIVVRCVEKGQKLLSFKTINPQFLLKYSD